jgi:hypothetical protein
MRRVIMLSLSVIVASFLVLAWQVRVFLTDRSLLQVTDNRLALAVGGQTCYSKGLNANWCENNAKSCTADGSNSFYVNYFAGVIYAYCVAHQATGSGSSSGSMGCSQIDYQDCYVTYYCTGSTDCSSGCVRQTPTQCPTNIQPSGAPCYWDGDGG